MGLVTGMAAILLIYVLVQIVCIGTLPGLAESKRPLADAATAFVGPAGAILITLGIVVSLAGNLNIVMLSASRVIFAMAERRELPSFLAAIHGRFHTPHWSIVGTGIVMLVVSAIARLAAYVFTCAALIAFRLDRNAPAAALKITAGPVIAVCAILLSAWLLSNSTWLEARNTAMAACAGLAVYAAYSLWRRRYSMTNK
jgi:amino acid transporter